MPKVSVIIPTYNTADYIAAAVESVLAQTYQDYEIIVVDDGSTDETRQVITPYLDRLRYVWQENQERAVARNHGLSLAQGEFVAFLDSDDLWLPEKLERQVAALEQHPQAVLTYAPVKVIDEAGQPSTFWGSAHLCGEPGGEIQVTIPGKDMLFGSPIMPSIVLVRREAFRRVGLFDSEVIPAEDWDMWLRLAQQGPFVWLPEVLARYRTPGPARELRRRTSDTVLIRTENVIKKITAARPEKYPPPVRDQALASVNVDSALASYELGNVRRGQRLLAKAIHLDPALAEPLRLTFRLEDYARRILIDSGDEDKALAFLDSTVANLPASIQPLQANARNIMSRVFMADAFRAEPAADRKKLQQMLWSGVRHDPSWLLNRGVLAMIARSLLRQDTGSIKNSG